MPIQSGILLFDADVLIDYMNSDLNVIKQVSEQYSPVYTITSVLNEVDGLDLNLCEKYRITVIEPVIGGENNKLSESKLSASDYLSFETAYCLNFVCVTNDNELRKVCKRNQVKTLWGLELLRILVEIKSMSSENAIMVAEKIQKSNSKYITDSIMERFSKSVKDFKT